ncbi:MAG: hypothetical protein IM631_05135 [Cytophagales bacterium]|nr:hypothetical protein [Cytophagales bacterium]MCA6370765.1 hypothetical protein [Cytophagales bacterium]MCA6385927.1 hypothetical protein [Cytophagales bacterium]
MENMTLGRIIAAGILLTIACLLINVLQKRIASDREPIGKQVLVGSDTLIITAIDNGNYVLSNKSVIDRDLALKLLINNNVPHVSSK